MRRLCIGVLLMVTALMGASASYAKDKDDSATTLPPLIAAGKIPCTLTASRFIAEGTMADKTKGKFYEAACQEGLGYVVIDHENNGPPTAFDCVAANEPRSDGKKSDIACILPGNTSSVAALQPSITKLGEPCTVTKTRVLGSSPDKSYFELACDSGAGYILMLPRAIGAVQPHAYNCLDMDPNGTTKCAMNDRDAYVTSQVTRLLAASGKTCALKDKRYVGTSTDESTFYEAACQAGDGYIIQAAPGGQFKVAIKCVDAFGILGGCTLTDARAALTQENALYSDLAKKSGFNCDVGKYAPFPPDGKNEVVELQCSNRPDGGVGVFPLHGGKPMVYDCLRAENLGYRCSYSTPDSLYGKLSAQLAAKGKGSCVVNGARPFGATSTSDLIEVSCADGGLGWVIEYPQGGAMPTDLLNCAQAAAASSAGCQLPTNKRK